tara:strand:+ start:654 stop:1634 length:981 start_codon:yes stop_codon:yes gene_type:complete
VNRYLKLFIAGLASVLGIYIAFQGENIEGLWSQIVQIDKTAFYSANILLLLSCFVRAYRWGLILEPIEKIKLKDLFASTMVGYFGNGVLAFRLGELLRAYSISQNRSISVPQAFGTVILERILDLLMVLFVFLLVIPWFPFEFEWLRMSAILFAGLIFGIMLFIFFSFKFQWNYNIQKLNILQTGFGKNIIHILNKIFDGIILIKNTKHSLAIIFSSILLWFMYYSVTIILLYACNINLGIVGSGILLIIGSFAIGIPALPGSAGTYDAGVKFGLITVFSIVSDKALTYALVSHFVSYFPVVIVGAIYFMMGSIKISEIQKSKVKI